MKPFAFLVAALTLLVLTLSASAKFDSGLVNVALAGRPGKESAVTGKAVIGANDDKWNIVQGDKGDHVQINDSNDELTDVAITFSSDGAFDVGERSGFAATKWANLMRRYIYARTPHKYTVVISGLTRGATYDLVLYSGSDAERSTRFTVGKESQTTINVPDKAELAQGVNYARFTATADNDGNVTILFEAAPKTPEGNFNGLQIAPKK
jgi:hypothetical protein